MTQEEKSLLLQDLCSRLPYGVKVRTNRGPEIIEGLAPFCHNEVKIALNLYWSMSIDGFKPYLRPMSSMTEGERQEYNKFNDFGSANLRRYEYEDFILYIPSFERVDWLNSHHFDYRGLIEKGLALEAPENIYG